MGVKGGVRMGVGVRVVFCLGARTRGGEGRSRSARLEANSYVGEGVYSKQNA